MLSNYYLYYLNIITLSFESSESFAKDTIEVNILNINVVEYFT